MPKKLITEKTVVDFFNQGKTEIEIDKNTIITPSARDKALQLRVKFVERRKPKKSSIIPLPQSQKLTAKRSSQSQAITLDLN
jgi:ethanolamine utilization cobalamin adenosyltransferase